MRGLLLAFVLLFGAAGAAPQAPGFALRDLNGAPVTLSQFRGHVVLLDFWASWCAPCIAELPDLLKFKAAHPGIALIGITLDDAEAAVHDPGDAKLKAFVAEHGMGFAIVKPDAAMNIAYGRLLGLKDGALIGPAHLINANLPSWILIDRAGQVRAIHKSSGEERAVLDEAARL